jgi:hypothetical protein
LKITKKQEAYRDLLMHVLPYINSCLNIKKFGLFKDDDVSIEAELIHNIYCSICDYEYTDHDLHFLNYQVEHYLKVANSKNSPNYENILKELVKLIRNCPPNYQSMLKKSVLKRLEIH